MHYLPTKQNTAAIMILYYPDDAVIGNIQSYADKVDKIYVIDNTPEKIGSYEQSIKTVGNLEYIGVGENIGIAAALNVGAQKAIVAGYKWVATFDQDSHAEDALFDHFREVWLAYPDKDKIAIITPKYADEHSAAVYSFADETVNGGSCYKECTTSMTSGNIINAAAYQRVGGFDEKLFIDYVDHDFCLRCHLRGYKVVEASNAILRHSVGRLYKSRFLGKDIVFSDHSPLRKYYFVRNVLYVYFNYYKQFNAWVTRDCKAQLKNNLKEYCFGVQRFHKVLYSLLGFYHFCRKRYGKL